MIARGLRFISLSIVALAVAVLAVSIRLDVPFEEARAAYANEASAFIELSSGAQVHYRDEEDRGLRPLILLHGAGGALQDWGAWRDNLEGRFRIIRLDLPGHGLTGRVPGDDYSRAAMADLVLELADALELERFAVAGAGLGGAVAWEIARRDEARVSHLILIAPEGIGGVPAEPPLAVIAARNPLTRPLVRWIAPRWAYANQLYKSFTDDNHVTDALVDRHWRLARTGGNRAATARRLGEASGAPLREYDGAIAVPAAILWGEDDQILPFDRERVEWDLRTKFTGGPQANPLYTFAGVGHYPHIEQAVLTAAFADNFIQAWPLESAQ